MKLDVLLLDDGNISSSTSHGIITTADGEISTYTGYGSRNNWHKLNSNL